MKHRLITPIILLLALVAASCGSDAPTATESTTSIAAEATTTSEVTATSVATTSPPATPAPAETIEPGADDAAEVEDPELATFPTLYQEFIADNGGSKWVDVLGSQMHYVEAGDPDGEVVLLGHGAPTNSFMWRNLLDSLATPDRRVIAFDLIGFGRSDHPDLNYSFTTHAEYMEGFIEALGLTDVHLVLHDISGQAGFGYAAANSDNVASIVSGEVLYRSFESLEEMGPFAGPFFEQLQTPGVGEALMIEQNMAITVLLDNGTATDLPKEIRDVYGSFFLTPESRDVNLEFARSTPVGGEPALDAAFVDTYASWLAETDVPKLVVRPAAGLVPGVQYDTASELANVTVIDLPGTGHFFMEDDPAAVTDLINGFYSTLGI